MAFNILQRPGAAEDFSAQVREAAAYALGRIDADPEKAVPALIEGLQDIGLCSRGSGADNIRNVTGTPGSPSRQMNWPAPKSW